MIDVSQLMACATCHLLEVREGIEVQKTSCAPFSCDNELKEYTFGISSIFL